MRKIEITETHEYNLFDVGEKVRNRELKETNLPPGIYEVSGYSRPRYIGSEAIIYLVGQKHGYNAAYFDDAADQEAEARPLAFLEAGIPRNS